MTHFRTSYLLNKDLKHKLEAISEEFDVLGIESININVDILDQLISSIHRLINLYKKTYNREKESKLNLSTLQSEIQSRQKSITALKVSLEDNKLVINKLKNDINTKDSEIKQLQGDNTNLQKEIARLKSYYGAKQSESEHQIVRLKEQNVKLQEQVGENIGAYKPKDLTVIETINKMKQKEEIYEDTIEKLKLNNTILLNEVLNLKEEVLNMIYNKNSTFQND